jgi:glyoxylate reductase
MWRVFVTRRIPRLELLEKGDIALDVFEEDRPPTKAEIVEGVRDADALICLLTDPIDKEVISSAPRLRVIGNYAVGYNNIDVVEATRRGIAVLNTPGVLTETTADLAFALLLAAARRVVEGDRFMRAGRFNGWAPRLLLGVDVYGKTLGIVGMGRIGAAVARRARGFNMRVLYWSRRRKEDVERETGAEYVPLDRLLEESDFVSVHTALTPETHHLIGEREIRRMKRGAILVNVARGEVVDERALIRALRDGHLRAAALDVFEGEPWVNPELLELENVVLTPHIGSASVETRTRMAEMVIGGVLTVLRGGRPENIVNPEVLRANSEAFSPPSTIS